MPIPHLTSPSLTSAPSRREVRVHVRSRTRCGGRVGERVVLVGGERELPPGRAPEVEPGPRDRRGSAAPDREVDQPGDDGVVLEAENPAEVAGEHTRLRQQQEQLGNLARGAHERVLVGAPRAACGGARSGCAYRGRAGRWPTAGRRSGRRRARPGALTRPRASRRSPRSRAGSAGRSPPGCGPRRVPARPAGRRRPRPPHGSRRRSGSPTRRRRAGSAAPTRPSRPSRVAAARSGSSGSQNSGRLITSDTGVVPRSGSPCTVCPAYVIRFRIEIAT